MRRIKEEIAHLIFRAIMDDVQAGQSVLIVRGGFEAIIMPVEKFQAILNSVEGQSSTVPDVPL